MLRFNRNYELRVDDGKNFTIITPPIKIVFEATKSIAGGLNTLNLQIYNLNNDHAQAFCKDAEQTKLLRVTLKVGYNDSLEVIFIGDVNTGFLGKQGPDIVNSMQIFDGGQAAFYGNIFFTVRTRKEMNNLLVSNMPTATMGNFTLQAEFIRPRVLVGNCNKIFQQSLDPNQYYFIDDNKVNLIKKDEFLPNYIAIVSPETGLMNTPERQNGLVSFETMMNPVIKIGGLVDLTSVTATYLNGIYRVEQIVTRGDNYGQDWKQTIVCILAQGFKKL